jgi:hypothetical protein
VDSPSFESLSNTQCEKYVWHCFGGSYLPFFLVTTYKNNKMIMLIRQQKRREKIVGKKIQILETSKSEAGRGRKK